MNCAANVAVYGEIDIIHAFSSRHAQYTSLASAVLKSAAAAGERAYPPCLHLHLE